MSALTVGQRLYVVPTQRHQGDPKWIVVEKIGRRWATCHTPDRYRFPYRVDKNTLRVDNGGYGSPPQCYVSEEAYQVERDRSALWKELRGRVDRAYEVPAQVTMDQMRTVLGWLT